MATTQLTLKIDGMHCASCAAAVERSVAKLPGVSEANVNFATENLHVDCDTSLSRQDIADAVVAAGFSVATPVQQLKEISLPIAGMT